MNNKLYLNKEIYDNKSIEIAIRAYNHIAQIDCIMEENWWVCYFKKCHYNIELTKMEFENYLIVLMNRRLSNATM